MAVVMDGILLPPAFQCSAIHFFNVVWCAGPGPILPPFYIAVFHCVVIHIVDTGAEVGVVFDEGFSGLAPHLASASVFLPFQR